MGLASELRGWRPFSWALVACAVVLTAGSANALEMYWSYGSGTWGTTSTSSELHWSYTSGSTGTSAWVDGSDAVFEGDSGVAVTVSSTAPPTVRNVTFNTTNYNLAGGTSRQLTLAGSSGSLGTSVFDVNANLATITCILGGYANLEKTGAGMLVENVNNTYTGLTTIAEGTLVCKVSGGLGSTNVGTVVNNGATLSLGSSSLGPVDIVGESLTINGQGVNNTGALNNALYQTSGDYDSTYEGLVTLGSDSRINCDTTTRNLTIGTVTTSTGYTLTVGGAGQTTISKVWGSGALVKDGSGTLIIDRSTSHTGGTTIQSGTLQLGTGTASGSVSGNIVNDSSLVFFNSPVGTVTNNVNYTGTLSGSGTLTKRGTALLRLGGANTSYSGIATVSEGILQVDNATALGNSGGTVSRTIVENGASLHLNTNGATINEYLELAGRGYLSKGALRNVSGTNTWAGDIHLTDGTHTTWITCADGQLTISGNINLEPVGYWSDDYGQLVFSDSDASDNIIVTGNITGGTTAWSVSKTTGGTSGGVLTLAGHNMYLGSTEISRGTLRVTGGEAIPDESVISLDRPITDVGSVAVFEVVESEKVGSIVSSSCQTTCNGTVQIDAGAELKIGGDNCMTRSRLYRGLIVGSGSLTKEGAGRQIFYGSNSYTGGTLISEGTLTAGNSSALGTGSIKVYGSNAVLETGSLLTIEKDVVLTTGTIAHACIASSGTTTVSGSGTLAARSYTLKKGIFGVSMSGSGTLTKMSDGDTAALTCTSPNYTGKTVISGGTLVITQDSSLGAAPTSAVSDQLTINGGTLRLSRGIAGTTLVSTGGTYSATAMPTATISGGGGTGVSVGVSCGVNATKFVDGGEAEYELEGWSALPDVIFAEPDMPGGVTATGSVTATWNDTTHTWTITGVTITNPGSGYTETPLMWVVNGSNVTGGQIWAKVTAVKVNGVVLPAGSGYGYTSTPTVTFSNGSAAATASLTSSSTILAATRGITLGSNGGTIETDSGFNAIVAGTISGGGALTKTGSGTLTMTTGNTYTGGTMLNAGTLQLGDGTTNGSVVGNIVGASGTALVFNNASSQLYDGNISGSCNVTKKGIGTLNFRGVMDCSGVTIEAGKLELGTGSTGGTVNGNIVDNALLSFNNNSSQTYGYVISGSGGLKKYGTGTLTLTGANSYGGYTTVSAGTLQIGNGGTTGLIGGGAVTIESGATLKFNRSNAYTVNNSISGSGALVVTSGGTLTYTGTSTLSGTTSISSSALGTTTLQLGDGATNGTYAGTILIGATAQLLFNNGSSQIFSGVIGGSTGTLSKSGAGTLTLTGNSTFSGPTKVNAGTLQIGAGSTTGSLNNGAINVASGATLKFNRSNAYTVNSTISGSGALVVTSGGTLTYTGASTLSGTTSISSSALGTTTLQLGDGTEEGTCTYAGTILIGSTAQLLFNNGATQTFDGVIGGSTGTLSKSGIGALTLVGANTYTGTTRVLAGKLQLGSGGSIGSVNGNIANSALLAFNYNGAQTYSYVVSGTGALKKLGTGTLTLTGVNTYTGYTSITDGTLRLSGSGSINGTSSITLDGGALLLDSSTALTRSITFTSGTLGGTGTYSRSDNLVVGSGHLSPGDGGIGELTLNCGTLTLSSSSVLDYDFGTTTGTCDSIDLDGATLVLDGTLNITCSGSLPGGDYVIFSGVSSLVDNGLEFGTTPSGHQYTYRLSGSSVIVHAAPEPGTIVMLMIGLIGFLGYARRRQKAASTRG